MSEKKTCSISDIQVLSENTNSFEIMSLNGPFDNLEAGSHLDVYLENGLIRQYSLWSWSEDKMRVSVAVKREDEGDGGSKAMHALEIGTEVQIDGPRNHFKLTTDKPHYTLIAGGIGVTPIFAMARELCNNNAMVDIHYLVQTKSLAAFAQHFNSLALGENASYQLHCDDSDGLFDFDTLLNQIPKNSAIYTCGPEPMLNAIISTVEKGNGTKDLHFERFTIVSEETEKPNNSFEVKIDSTGEVYTVGEDQTILTVLARNGVDVPSACAAGLCGTCITDVLEGDIDHRDGILSVEEKASNEYMCVCISRAKSAQITLDL